MAIIEFIVVSSIIYIYLYIYIDRYNHLAIKGIFFIIFMICLNLDIFQPYIIVSYNDEMIVARYESQQIVQKNYDGQKLISHQAWDTLCHVYKLLKFSRCFELQIFWFWFQCNFVVGNQVHSCSRRQASLWFHFLIIKERVYFHDILIP